MRTIRIVWAALLVGACTSAGESAPRTPGQSRVVGDGWGVVVTNVKNEEEGRPLAEKYCAERDQSAHFNRIMQYRYRRIVSVSASFECVPRAG